MHERQLKTQEKIIFQYHSRVISGRVLVTVYLIEKLFREILKNRNTYVKLWRAERKGAREKKKVREGTWRLETFSSMQRTESF